MLHVRRVVGNSMVPGIVSGTIVVTVSSGTVKPGDVVIARQKGREVIKRVTAIQGGMVELRGDNTAESNDSRRYGPVAKRDILGVVMIRFARAIDPPGVSSPLAIKLGWIAAVIMTMMALIHLFRIDTLLPLLDKILPGGGVVAALIGASLLVVEVFAVPYLLRMKLSPLMHLKSGLDAVLAPLTWLLISIWALGVPHSTAQLGEFVETPSNWFLITINAVWLGFNLWTLRSLGYERIADNLRKQR